MLRLSRKGWNNVLIIGVISMIFILNLTNEQRTADDPSASNQPIRLLELDTVILTMDYPAAQFERIGKSWRSTINTLSVAQIQQLEQDWLALDVMELKGAKVELAPEAVVRLTVMGLPEPLTVALINSTGLNYLVVNSRVFEISAVQVDRLFPLELIELDD